MKYARALAAAVRWQLSACRWIGCQPDWVYAIACGLERPPCIRCHREL